MASNCANVQISNVCLPTTLQEKKLLWMEKQIEKEREKKMKVRCKGPSEIYRKY